MEDRNIPKRVFIVGAPRSGTSWLNLLLFQHPSVAAAPETHIFSTYIKALDDTWKFHEATSNALTQLISREEFNQMLREFASRVIGKIEERKPGAQVVVEKTPAHGLYGEMIHTLFPDAYFLNITRDPRAVANSLLHASQSWAARWAPSNAVDATRRWIHHVSASREIVSFCPNYREVRYEELLSRGPETLQDIFEWLGLSGNRAFCEEVIEACRIENIRQGRDTYQSVSSNSMKPGRARTGKADSWESELSKRQIRIIESLAGDLMDKTNYQRVFPDTATKPVQLILREWAEAVFTGVFRWVVKRMPPSMTAAAKKIGVEDLR